MMPNSMPPMGGGSPTPPAPSPAGLGGSPQGGPSPDQARQMLIQVLTKAKQMADQAGIDWKQLVASVGGGGAQPPLPPASARPPMPTSGGGANPEKGGLSMSPNNTKQNGLY